MFAAGLNTMNIAPEFGQIESMTYLEAMDGRPELVESFYQICLDSRRWVKWFSAGLPEDKVDLIKVCGHYVLSSSRFISEIRSKIPLDIDAQVQHNVISRLEHLHGLTA